MEQIDGWEYTNNALEQRFTFADFAAALAFINKVGVVAEELNHHPDISNSYNKVTLRLSTHDAGGVTEKDIELAKKISVFV